MKYYYVVIFQASDSPAMRDALNDALESATRELTVVPPEVIACRAARELPEIVKPLHGEYSKSARWWLIREGLIGPVTPLHLVVCAVLLVLIGFLIGIPKKP